MGKNRKRAYKAWSNEGWDHQSWGGSNSGASQDASQPKPWQQKNWKCDTCGYTSNCHWWWTCGRATCGAQWEPKGETVAATSAETTNAQELSTARDELKALVILLPEGHPTITEFATKVRALEEAQKTGVSTAERLRRCLQTQKQLASKESAALAARDKAKVELAKATAAMKARIDECEVAVQAIAANALEIAEVTRSAAPAVDGDAPVDLCQELRAQVEILTPQDLAEAGTDMAGMGQFFTMFSKFMALLERAKTREVAPPPAATPSLTIMPVTPAAAVAMLQPAEIPLGHPNPFTQILPEDDEDDEDEDDADAIMTGEGAAARELEKAEKLLEDIKAKETGSCG